MLEDILAATRHRVAEARRWLPLADLEQLAASGPPPIDLTVCLAQPGVQLIAEIKRRSPSRGDLKLDLDPASLAADYAHGGAAALSVLTEPRYFAGSLEDLLAARAGLETAGRSLPILRKDFFVDPYQVAEARAWAADAVLLIVAALSDASLRLLYGEAQRWGLHALVEVHDEAELERALALKPRIVGINSRDLRTMTVDLAVVERLRPRIPADTLVVAESGIRSTADVQQLRSLGVDAMLVGEELVRSGRPQERARELVEAGR